MWDPKFTLSQTSLLVAVGLFRVMTEINSATSAHPALPLLPTPLLPPLAPPNCGLYWLKEAPRTDQNCQKPGEMRICLVDNERDEDISGCHSENDMSDSAVWHR